MYYAHFDFQMFHLCQYGSSSMATIEEKRKRNYDQLEKVTQTKTAITTEFTAQIEIPIVWISFYFLTAIKKELINRIERIRWPCLTENKTTAPTQCLATHPPSHATFLQIVDETEPAPGNNVFRVNQKELGRASPQRTLVNGVGKVPFVEYRVSPANQSTLFDLADTRRIRPGE